MKAARMFAHVAAEGAARALAAGFTLAVLVALICDRPGAAFGLAALAGAFLTARPGPAADLDRESGRRD